MTTMKITKAQRDRMHVVLSDVDDPGDPDLALKIHESEMTPDPGRPPGDLWLYLRRADAEALAHAILAATVAKVKDEVQR